MEPRVNFRTHGHISAYHSYMRKSVAQEGGEEGSFEPPTPHKRVIYYLEELLEKHGPRREKALVSIVEVLSSPAFELELDFLETNFATFLYRCLTRIKKGSAKEMHLASQAIGLLALIIDDEDDENEVYREVLPVVSKALKSGPKTLKVFDCLAIGTFFGATHPEETQTAMQAIWTFIHPESGSNVNARKHSPEVLVAAISAWLFLLTGLDGWSLSSKYWQGAISYFSNLLEGDDQTVSTAAGEGLALIFEKRSVDKFCSREEKSCGESSTAQTYSCIKESVKDGILEKLDRLCLKQRSENAAGEVCKEYLHILDYFKSGSCPNISAPIGRGTQELASWSKVIQLKYLKSFLGDHGLKVHMTENRKVRAAFGKAPTKYYAPRRELYVPTVEEVKVTCFLPKERDLSSLLSADIKKDRLMRSSVLDKAKTRIKNKNRKLAEARKHSYGFY